MTPNQLKFEKNLLRYESLVSQAHEVGLGNLKEHLKIELKEVAMELFNYILLHKADDPIYRLKKKSYELCIKELEKFIK